jgi:membrane protein implicated in regulation of membrane protease activity
VIVLLGAILLAVFVLDSPWSYAVIVGAVAFELTEAWVLIRWSQRRTVSMGAETLVGETGEVVDALRPEGRVRVQGELWRARSPAEEELPAGAAVRVRALDGLVLEVERV